MSHQRFFLPGRYELAPSAPITHFVREPATEGVLAAHGLDIAWPNGERWTHDHIAGELPNTTQQEAA